MIWALKGKPGLLDDVLLDGETRSQRLRITPFPGPGTSAVWEPYRQTIETDDGVPVVARADPAGSFAGLGRDSPWEELQVAYFASEANWDYPVSPFLFGRPEFVTEEFEPWHEDGEVWRSLVVTYPDTVVAHNRQQTYYSDGDGLLRRIDSSVDILGGGPAVHYPSDYQEFDGIMVPTRRRVFVRNPDGTHVRDSVSVAMEIPYIRFS